MRIADLSRVANCLLLIVGTSDVAVAQETRLMATETDCLPIEPDSVQISWSTPCDSGSWLIEPGVPPTLRARADEVIE
jgi:hypothetical protein